MKKKAFLLLLILISFNIYSMDLITISPDSLGEKTLNYIYEEHYYDGIGESSLELKRTDIGFLILWYGITDTTEIYTDSQFNTLSMNIRDENTELSIIRDGNKLKVEGFDKGRSINKTLKIKSALWYQLMPAQLSAFVNSDDTETLFSMFDPYNIKVMDMSIKKEGIERIDVGGEEIESVKINMRIQGFLSLFWKSEIWYSTKSKLQIKYEGINVIPKMYNAVIKLKSIELGSN